MEFSWSPPRCRISSSDSLSRQRLICSSEICIHFTEAERNTALVWSAMRPHYRRLLQYQIDCLHQRSKVIRAVVPLTIDEEGGGSVNTAAHSPGEIRFYAGL